MSLKRRIFSKEFKQRVISEVESGRSLAETARRHEVHPTLISKWRKQLSQYGERAFAGNGNVYTDEATVSNLERMIGHVTVENDFLKKALQRLEQKLRSATGGGNKSCSN